MHTLPIAGRLRLSELRTAISTLPKLAAELDAPPPDLSIRLIDAYDLLADRVVPHMEHVETTLYPQLERLMQNRHSMTPMRREHAEIRALVEEFGTLAGRELTFGHRLRIRRVMFHLYAMLEMHLADEDAYLGVLDHNLSAAEQAEIVAAMEQLGA